jgi:hypothetical protein
MGGDLRVARSPHEIVAAAAVEKGLAHALSDLTPALHGRDDEPLV